MAILFQYGYVYDPKNRQYTTVKALNADVDYHWDNLQVGYWDNPKGLNFCAGVPDFYWPEDAKEIIEYFKSTQITVPNIGEYSATVTKDGIKVGCQTITFGAFDELTKAVNTVRTHVS